MKNGRIDNGKQSFLCREGGRQFVEHRQKKVVDSPTGQLIDRLWLERIALAGIARAVQVSEPWLQTYVQEKYASLPRQVDDSAKKSGD